MIQILKWLMFVPCNILMTLLAYILAPILPMFAIHSNVLPKWLSWFQTPDNSLDGDKGWRTQHWLWRFNLPFWISQYVGRVGWLLRNPAYGFDTSVCQISPIGSVKVHGNLPLGGSPKRSGWYFAQCKNAFQFYAIIYWGNHASRINFGWKLWSSPNKCQFVMTVSPFMKKTGS